MSFLWIFSQSCFKVSSEIYIKILSFIKQKKDIYSKPLIEPCIVVDFSISHQLIEKKTLVASLSDYLMHNDKFCKAK